MRRGRNGIADPAAALHQKQLAALDSEIQAISKQNADLTSEIEQLRRSNTQQRESADEFKKRNAAILDELRSMQASLSFL